MASATPLPPPAQRGNPAPAAVAAQRVEKRRQHTGAGRSDRVAEGHSAALDIHLRRIERELPGTATAWAANASFNSNRSTAPSTIRLSSSPSARRDWRHHDVLRLESEDGRRHDARERTIAVCSPPFSKEVTSAAAPSFTPGALPAVTVPSFLNAGFNFASGSDGRVGAPARRSRGDRIALLLRDLVRERSRRGNPPAAVAAAVRIVASAAYWS